MTIAFTFDDGPGASTRNLLSVLDRHGCKATFFLIGDNLASGWWSQDASMNPRSVALDIVRAGHILGNHTMTHRAKLSLRQLSDEIKACDALIAEVYASAGVSCPHPIPFRLPYGIKTYIGEQIENGVRKQGAALDNRLQVLASLGRTHVHWTALLPDWNMKSGEDVETLVKSAVDHVERMDAEGLNAVFALHDGRQKSAEDIPVEREFTVQAVSAILEEAASRGWQTIQIPEVGFNEPRMV